METNVKLSSIITIEIYFALTLDESIGYIEVTLYCEDTSYEDELKLLSLKVFIIDHWYRYLLLI